MIAIDTNILVYASVTQCPQHAAARSALQQLALSASPWGVPFPCAHEFLAITTNREIFADPLSATEALLSSLRPSQHQFESHPMPIG